MQSTKEAVHDFEAWLKGSRCGLVHLNNLCKQTINILYKKAKCPFILNKKAKMCLYCSHGFMVYNERLSRAERVNFDVGIRRFIFYDLCDIHHVRFSREITSLVLKPFGLQFDCNYNVIQA